MREKHLFEIFCLKKSLWNQFFTGPTCITSRKLPNIDIISLMLHNKLIYKLNIIKNLKLTNLDTGANDKYGASSGAQQVNTAKLNVVNSLFRKVDLIISTIEKPLQLKEGDDAQLTITTPSNAEVNMTAVDRDTAERYYINGELVYKVQVKPVGVIEKIYIGDSKYTVCNANHNEPVQSQHNKIVKCY